MIDEKDLVWRFFAATSGPGGQNVNKVATAVELRWNVWASAYNETVKQRIAAAAGRKLAASGDIVIVAKGTRSQDANKAAALVRLREVIAKGTKPVVKRRASKPTKGSRERRLEGKRVRSGIKAGRGRVVE
jgi:ribosome-associated protein